MLDYVELAAPHRLERERDVHAMRRQSIRYAYGLWSQPMLRKGRRIIQGWWGAPARGTWPWV